MKTTSSIAVAIGACLVVTVALAGRTAAARAALVQDSTRQELPRDTTPLKQIRIEAKQP